MSFKSFALKLTVFTIILFVIHYLIANYLLPVSEGFYTIYAIYVFLYCITLAVYGLVIYANKSFSDYTGYAFMAGSLLKMFISVVFLIPVLTGEHSNKLQQIAFFFVPYFLYLIFETLQAVKLLNKN